MLYIDQLYADAWLRFSRWLKGLVSGCWREQVGLLRAAALVAAAYEHVSSSTSRVCNCGRLHDDSASVAATITDVRAMCVQGSASAIQSLHAAQLCLCVHTDVSTGGGV
jgi:hypothetical protein